MHVSKITAALQVNTETHVRLQVACTRLPDRSTRRRVLVDACLTFLGLLGLLSLPQLQHP